MLNSWRMMLSKAVCTRRMKCPFHSKHPKYELRNYNSGLRSTQNKNSHHLLTNSNNKAAWGGNFSELMLWNLSGYLSGRKRNNNWDQCKKAPLCLKRRVSEDGLRTLFVQTDIQTFPADTGICFPVTSPRNVPFSAFRLIYFKERKQ